MKNFLAILLCGAMLLGLVSCYQSDNGKETPPSETETETEDNSITESQKTYAFISYEERATWKSKLISIFSKIEIRDYESGAPGSRAIGLMDINFDNSPEVLVAYAGGSMGNVYIEIYDLDTGENLIAYNAAHWDSDMNINLFVADKNGEYAIFSEGYLRNADFGWLRLIDALPKDIDSQSVFLETENLFATSESNEIEYYKYNGTVVEKSQYEAHYQQFLKDYHKIEDTKTQLILWSSIKSETRDELIEKMADALINCSQQFIDNNKLYYIPTTITETYNGEVRSSVITLDANSRPVTITYGKENLQSCDYAYDANGNVTKLTCTYASGNKTVTDYTYDETGNVIKTIYTGSNGQQEITDYSYDSCGRRIKSILTLQNGTRMIFECTYDVNGRMIREIQNFGDSSSAVTDYTYDSNGNLIKKVFTDFNDAIAVTDYSYDVNNRILNEICTYPDNDKSTIDYTYNADGDMTQKLVVHKNGATNIYDYANGKMVKSVYVSADGGNKITYQYIYDTNGNLIMQKYTFSNEKSTDNPTVVTDHYTYDANGNLLQKITVGADGEITKSIVLQYQSVIFKNDIPKQIQEALDTLLADIYSEVDA